MIGSIIKWLKNLFLFKLEDWLFPERAQARKEAAEKLETIRGEQAELIKREAKIEETQQAFTQASARAEIAATEAATAKEKVETIRSEDTKKDIARKSDDDVLRMDL